jgi:hypothetical protein
MAVEQPDANDHLDTPSHSLMHRVVATDASASAQSVAVQADNRFDACAGKCGLTPEGGFYITLTNKTGGATTKGYLVKPSSGTDNAFDYVASGEPDIIGVVYDAGIADGSACRIVVAGIADVYVSADGASREDFVRMNAAGDTSTADGVATAEAVPSSPFSTDKHFQEVGHALEARGDAGLIKCIVHFN